MPNSFVIRPGCWPAVKRGCIEPALDGRDDSAVILVAVFCAECPADVVKDGDRLSGAGIPVDDGRRLCTDPPMTGPNGGELGGECSCGDVTCPTRPY